LTYRIKSETEAYERNVPESQLRSDVGAESEYATTEPRLPAELKPNIDIE